MELCLFFLLRFYLPFLCLINNSETALFLLWVFLPRFGTAKTEGREREGSEPGFGSHWPRLRSQTSHSGRSLVWQSVSWSVRWGFPGGSVVKESACNAGDTGSMPWLGRSCGVGNGNPLQFSCLGNPWTEEPGGLQSMGSQRIRHNWATKHSTVRKKKLKKKPTYEFNSVPT